MNKSIIISFSLVWHHFYRAKVSSSYFGHQRRRIADNPAIPGKRISDTALLIHIKAVLQPAKANMAGQGFGESFELIVCEFGKNGFDDS